VEVSWLRRLDTDGWCSYGRDFGTADHLRMLHSPTVSGRILPEFSESAGIQWNPVDSFGRECHSNLIPVTIFLDRNGQDDQYLTGMDGTHFQWIPVE
jgi:hypothetical protein